MQLIDCIIGQWFQKLLECYKFVANWAEINRESLTFKWPKNLHLSLLSRPTAQGTLMYHGQIHDQRSIGTREDIDCPLLL